MTMPDFSHLPDDRLLAAEQGLHTMFAKAVEGGADTETIVLTHEDVARELRQRQYIYDPLAKATDHDFVPVRNICRTCRAPGPPAHGDADHDFTPVRNVCKGCGQGEAVHKAAVASPSPFEAVVKSLGDDITPGTAERIRKDATIGAIYAADDVEAVLKALPDLSVEDRQGMAQTGVAMPDGSFPIPDEAHLHAAVRLVGQAADPQAAMNHIIERAKAMGLEYALPPTWQQDPNAQQPNAVGPGAHSTPNPQMGGKPEPQRSPMAGGGAGGAGAAAGASSPAGGGGGSGGASTSKPGLMKRLAKAMGAAMGADFDEEAFVKEMEIELDPEFEYAILKSRGEDRYTLGPVYMPDTLDAHGEWATADDLEKASWSYFKAEDHDVYLQHSDKKAGELVALMPWPHEVAATMQKSIDGVRKSVTTTFPAGTVYAGVLWEPWAWEEVKKGKISGFSMGGWAQRLEGAPA